MMMKMAIRLMRDKGLAHLAAEFSRFSGTSGQLPLLHVQSARLKDIDESVDFAISGCRGLIAPLQNRDEIVRLLQLVRDARPRCVLEIGTAHGGTLFLLSRVAADDALIISIDLPGGEFGGGYPAWRKPLYRSFALPKQEIILMRADSHAPETLRELKGYLKGRRLDFLWIDGDHTFKGVTADYETYSQLVGEAA